MKVLVAVDNDNYAKIALSSLRQRIWPEGTQFTLVHVVELDNFDPSGSVESIEHLKKLNIEKDREFQKQRMWLQELIEENQGTLGNMHHLLLSGNINHCLNQLTETIRPTYFVMGSHQRSAQQRIWIKSISSALVDKLNCCMEVIKPASSENIEYDMRPKNIVVALDGSDNSLIALEWLVQQELLEDTCIKLIMILTPSTMAEVEGYRPQFSSFIRKPFSTKQKFCSIAREWFADQLEKTKLYLNPLAVEGVCVEGEAVDKILELSMQWNADLIVMGSHGGKGLVDKELRKTAGSTTQAVVEQAQCNVIMIHVAATELPEFRWQAPQTYSGEESSWAFGTVNK